MKVGLITTGFPRFEGDHCGAFLLTLARGLVSHGCEVRVLAPEPAQTKPPPAWPGIEVCWVPYARPRRLQETFYGNGVPDNLRAKPARWAGAASLSVMLRLSARRALADCDALVSSWCVPSGWVASTIAEGRDHLCVCHATDVRWLSRLPNGGALGRQIAAGATSMWFLSRADRARFWATAGLRDDRLPSHVGPMPIEPPRPLGQARSSLRKEMGMTGFTVLFLGRLVPIKGVDQLLHAASKLESAVQLRIAGDGAARSELAALAERLGVDVRFEGWVAGQRKEALLQACDLMVVPSRAGDGLPSVIFEARARSLPIIATRAGAISEHLQESGSVRLVPMDDVHALRCAIRDFAVTAVPVTA